MSDEIKLSAKLDKVAKEIEGLTAIELAELAKYMEDKFKLVVSINISFVRVIPDLTIRDEPI